MCAAKIAVISLLAFPGASLRAATNGTVCATVEDPGKAAIPGAKAELTGPRIQISTQTDAAGLFCFEEIEQGTYELKVKADGFRTDDREVTIAPNDAVRIVITLMILAAREEVTVVEEASDPASLNVAQTKFSSGLIEKLPSESVNAAMSSVLTLTTPGVAADSNGVFHPLGEHAETSFSVDGQPISDQQSRIFSNQISLNTIEEMRTIQGAPPAEYGDKTSLIVEATTKSGLDAGRTKGTVSAGYGSFDTPTASVTFSAGTKTLGNFLAADGINSHRFLDSPEFQPLHANGNAANLFDRFDWRPSDATALHVNVSAAHSWFQVPNTLDQERAGQDQRQHMSSFNAGLAFSRVLTPSVLLMANIWVRQDRVNYFPSGNLFSDQPATLSQSRRLTSTGGRTDLAYVHGRHAIKGGFQLQVTPISEEFQTGLSDPGFNSPCVDAGGTPVSDPALTSTAQCAGAGYKNNSGFQSALLPYDLTRGGTLFQFRGNSVIKEESAYLQDSIKLGDLYLNLGIRYDNYDGLSKGFGVQPRTGISYHIRPTDSLLHFSYARVFLTPYNENLVLSSATGPGGLANGSLGANGVEPLTPARRNQFNVGFEQKLASKFSVEAEYFWKFTAGAYDFNTILNTPLNFPIQFRKAKIDGAMVRTTLSNVHGFSAFMVLGHTRSRLFSPEIGGINFGSGYAPVARPDHDQGFQQTTNLQYQFSGKSMRGMWFGLTWRYDSGLVVVSVPDYATALTLSGDEQQQIGLYCGTTFATVDAPLRNCASTQFGATRIHIVPAGTYNADTNPSRITPRNLFDVALGSDSIWKKEPYALGVKLTVVNLTDKIALYNFLSSFSGTHFVAPRSVQAQITFHF